MRKNYHKKQIKPTRKQFNNKTKQKEHTQILWGKFFVDLLLLGMEPGLECSYIPNVTLMNRTDFLSPLGINYKKLLCEGGTLCLLLLLYVWICASFNFI